MRGAVYIDGFNLYHAVDDIGVPHLKWCNFWELARLITKGHAKTLEKVVFCTAYFPGMPGKRSRHEMFVRALDLVGVETRLGHVAKESVTCKLAECEFTWWQPTEKATDINLSLAIIEDAMDNVFDIAFLVTADTDQVATINSFRKRFPEKRIFIVSPPGRQPSEHLDRIAHGKVRLKERHFHQTLLPAVVTAAGKNSVARPTEYDPPFGEAVV
ncbi:MAG: hypothetical protein B7Y97_03345 [Sphingomonas sp. 32-66-10]|nr:MAG: hypothetical protein B7Y97_03345 [Sphingomonas sp. 32-66-10]